MLGADRVDGLLDGVDRVLVDGLDLVTPRFGTEERGAGRADDGVRVLGAARVAPDLPPGAAPRLASPRSGGTLVRGAGRADEGVLVDGAAWADGRLGPSRPGDLTEPVLLPLLGDATEEPLAVRFGLGAEATMSEAPRGVALRRVAVRATVPRGLSL